jgi:hypothetical protein
LIKRTILVAGGLCVAVTLAACSVVPVQKPGAPLVAKPNPLAAVPLRDASNGCGPGAHATTAWRFGDTWTYRDGNGGSHEVDFRAACDIHDAGYAGAVVRDPFARNQLVDFWSWSREQVDDEFLRNLRILCNAQLRTAGAALATCDGNNPWTAKATATRLRSLVGAIGGFFWDERPYLAGRWEEMNDRAAPPWILTQTSGGYDGLRHVTIDYRENRGRVRLAGHFQGTLKTYIDRWVVEGTDFETQGSLRVASAMTLVFPKDAQQRSFSWTRTSRFGRSEGTMVRSSLLGYGVGVATSR